MPPEWPASQSGCKPRATPGTPALAARWGAWPAASALGWRRLPALLPPPTPAPLCCCKPVPAEGLMPHSMSIVGGSIGLDILDALPCIGGRAAEGGVGCVLARLNERRPVLRRQESVLTYDLELQTLRHDGVFSIEFCAAWSVASVYPNVHHDAPGHDSIFSLSRSSLRWEGGGGVASRASPAHRWTLCRLSSLPVREGQSPVRCRGSLHSHPDRTLGPPPRRFHCR